MRRLVRNPDMCGIRPGWEENIWSIEISSPGLIFSGVWVEPEALPFVRQGRQLAVQNWEATQRSTLILQSTSRLGRYPNSDNLNILGKDKWWSRWCKSISFWWTGVIMRGRDKTCASYFVIPMLISSLKARVVDGILDRYGWSLRWRWKSYTVRSDPFCVQTVWGNP